MGLASVVAPLFEVKPLDWQVPDTEGFDALLFTSANAPRLAGAELQGLLTLPCYCVGEATAAEAREAGWSHPVAGPSDGAALLDIMASDGVRRAFHLCGRDRTALEHPSVEMTPIAVYAADAVDRLPQAAMDALEQGAVALLHSPRAGRVFSGLVDAAGLHRGAIRVAAISEAAAEAAGGGWASCSVSAEPRDNALLELAAKLCNIGRVDGTGLAR